MIPIGFSAAIKDRRVDKIVLDQGYINYEIFYSPISIWLWGTIYLLIMSLPVTLRFYGYWP